MYFKKFLRHQQKLPLYRGTDKSLAPTGRKQATATEVLHSADRASRNDSW